MSDRTQNSFLTKNSLPMQVKQAESSCCSTTDDGAAICIVPENGSASACGCNGATLEDAPERSEPDNLHESTSLHGKVRSGVLFAVACLASPCCTPLLIPLALVLLAGTPVAIWLSAHIGWVYGALTLISVVSLVLAFRWWPKSSTKQQTDTAVSFEPTTLPQTNYSLEK